MQLARMNKTNVMMFILHVGLELFRWIDVPTIYQPYHLLGLHVTTTKQTLSKALIYILQNCWLVAFLHHWLLEIVKCKPCVVILHAFGLMHLFVLNIVRISLINVVAIFSKKIKLFKYFTHGFVVKIPANLNHIHFDFNKYFCPERSSLPVLGRY